MYDRITLWKDKVGEDCSHLVSLLENVKEQVSYETGEQKIFGSIKGMMVYIYPHIIRIDGSLTKFRNKGSNLITLNREETQEALNCLSEELHFGIEDARVSSLEFGTNFVMRYKPSAYIERMGDMPRRKKHLFSVDTLYYKHKGRSQPSTYVLYDKVADARAKGMTIPMHFENSNFLRVELRLQGSIARQMGVTDVNATTLYQRDFYKKLMAKYIECYFSISKINKLNTDFMERIKTPKDAVDGFVGLLLAEVGRGPQRIDEYIEELKAQRIFAERTSLKRVKDALAKALNKAKLSEKDELVAELDDQFLTLKSDNFPYI